MSDTPVPPAAPLYWEVVSQNVPFRRLWLGALISFCGDWFSLIALYTIVQELSGATLAIAGVLIAKTLPIFLVMPIAGQLIDRFDRRMLMLIADFARVATTVAVIVAHGMGSLTLLFTVLVIHQGFSGLFIPARTAVIGQVTSPRELPVAVALQGGSWSVMAALGAAMGGLATALIGIDGALVLDALTYVLSAVFLWGLPALPPRTADEQTQTTTFVDGLRYLRGRVYLPALLLLKTALALAAGSLVLIPVYGNGVFAATAGPVYVGLIYSLRGLGALVGSMGLRTVIGDHPHTFRLVIVPALLGMGASLALVALAPNVWWVSVAHFFAALGTGVVWVFSSTLAQQIVPNRLRGRLFALDFGVMTLMHAAVTWTAGYAADHWGLTPAMLMLVSGGVMVLPALVWAVVLVAAPDIPSHPHEHADPGDH